MGVILSDFPSKLGEQTKFVFKNQCKLCVGMEGKGRDDGAMKGKVRKG